MVWYEKYGMNENVFNPQKNLSKEIKGEEEVIETVNAHIKDKNICLLYGEAGTGKTTILIELAKSHNGIYINCETVEGNIRDRIKGLRNLVKKKIIFLDELHSLNEDNVNMIKGLYDEDKVKAIVCSQMNKEFKSHIPEAFISRIGEDFVSTKKPSVDECIAIVEARIEGLEIFDDGVLKKIVGHNYNNPRKILKDCSELCKFKDGDKPITLEDYQTFLKSKPKGGSLSKESNKEDSPSKVISGSIKLSKTQDNILDYLRNGAKGLDEVSDKFDMKQGTAGKQLKRMEEKGAVIIMKKGTKKMYDIEPEYKITILKDGGRDE